MLRPPSRAERAHARVVGWHQALTADALGAGAVGALWHGAWTDAWMLTHAQRMRPKLDKPFAIVDAICGAPQMLPAAHGAPRWAGGQHIACLVALSLGLAAKSICLCLATAASLGAFGIQLGRAAWAHLRAQPDAPSWQTLWTNAAGEGDAAQLLRLAAVTMGFGAPPGASVTDAQRQTAARLLNQDAARLTQLLMRLCQHPQAALSLLRWAQQCRALAVDTPQTPLWTLLTQCGVSNTLRDAVLQWSADGLEALAQLTGQTGGPSSVELAALWESVLHLVGHWLDGQACAQAQVQVQQRLTAWLDEHERDADDAAWNRWCAQGSALVTQCKQQLHELVEQQAQTWPARLAALHALCPPAAWRLVGLLVGLTTQPATPRLQSRAAAVAAAPTVDDDERWSTEFAAYTDAAWVRWLSDARTQPMWRGLAEWTELVRQVEQLGKTLLAAMPVDSPNSPWRLVWAAAREVMMRHAPVQLPAHDARDTQAEAQQTSPPCLDPYLHQSVQAKHGYMPPRAKASLTTTLWPDATTVVSKSEVQAFYQALRRVHAGQLGVVPTNLDEGFVPSLSLDVAANFLLALGQVLAVDKQYVTQPYCHSGRLNMRRYMQASLRPQKIAQGAHTFYDRRTTRPVRSRSLRFTMLAPGTINFERQSPWTLLSDVMDGHRRIAARWRDMAHTFVVLEALFSGSEAQSSGFPNLLAPLSPHLQLATRPKDSWSDASQNANIRKDPSDGAGALAIQMRRCVEQSRAKPPRDATARHKAPAHEVGVWLMTPEQAPDVWAHEQRLKQQHPYFSAVGVVMGEGDDLPTAVRDAFIILPSPDVGLGELAGRIEMTFSQLQAADEAWDESFATR